MSSSENLTPEEPLFIEGTPYTRNEIHAVVGGGTEDYLPHTNKNVVCVCIRPDLNPEAPKTILVGDGKDIIRWANVFRRQIQFVPTFIKRASKEWVYIGDYRVKSSNDEPEVIELHAGKANRDDVVRVLFLEKAK